MKVFVLGIGGWGIALAMLLHQNGHEVTSWTYLQAVSYTHLTLPTTSRV